MHKKSIEIRKSQFASFLRVLVGIISKEESMSLLHDILVDYSPDEVYFTDKDTTGWRLGKLEHYNKEKRRFYEYKELLDGFYLMPHNQIDDYLSSTRNLFLLSSLLSKHSIVSQMSEYLIKSIVYNMQRTSWYSEYLGKDTVTETLRKYSSEMEVKLSLFGSFSRGDFDDLSDIDLMLLGNFSPQEAASISKNLLINVSRDLGRPVSVFAKQLFPKRLLNDIEEEYI